MRSSMPAVKAMATFQLLLPLPLALLQSSQQGQQGLVDSPRVVSERGWERAQTLCGGLCYSSQSGAVGTGGGR